MEQQAVAAGGSAIRPEHLMYGAACERLVTLLLGRYKWHDVYIALCGCRTLNFCLFVYIAALTAMTAAGAESANMGLSFPRDSGSYLAPGRSIFGSV